MSYILDALRRADAERERSESPGLHAHHATAVDPEDAPPGEGRLGRWVTGGAVAAVVLAAGVYLALRGGESPQEAAPTAPQPVTQLDPAPAMPVPPVASVQAPPAPAPAVAIAPPVVNSLPPMPAPPAPESRPATPAPAATPPVPAPVPAAAATTPPPAAPSPTAAAKPAAPAPASAAPAPEPRVPALAELPEEVRREIPPLTIGGAMYSPTPANRMLIVNGQVTREGEQPVPGVVLEQINLKSAVLRFRNQRFRISY